MQHRPLRALRRAGSALALGMALVAGAQPALAQQQPPLAQITPPNRSDLIPPELRREEKSVTLTVDGDFERPPCALDRPEFADIRFTVKGAAFVGLDRVPGLSLDQAYADYVGRELPVSVLCDIRAEANALLRSKGYLATVEIPEQSLADGIPDFRVVFGRLTAVRVRGEAGPSERLVASYLEKLTQQDVFNTNTAERYLLLADDLPGLDVRLSLRPAAGGAPGDLVGEIAVLRQKAMADVNIQNLGSRAIGRLGGVLRGEIYDVTGLGDRTSVALFSTLDFDEQQTLQLGHDFRVGSEGLRFGGQLTLSQTKPATGIAGFNVEAETLFASLYASYPLVRSRKHSIYVDGGFDVVDQNVDVNNVALTRDKVRVAFARVAGEVLDQRSVLRADGYSPFEPRFRLRYGIEARHGLDVLDASPDCRANLLGCLLGGAAPPSRIEADPTPFLVRLNAGIEWRPLPQLAFVLDNQGQITNDPLPAFEEIAAGSFSIGRGYDPGAVLGDSGVLNSLEVRFGTLMPTRAETVAWQTYLFSDVAHVWNEDPSRRAANPDRLWSAGAGVRFAWGQGLQGDFLVAAPLVRPDLALEKGDIRFLFTLTARLLPWRF
ncbi:ShlB/FhaC/HecB family hemolysin secretion/activation protein [Erythrobacter sp. BLCC-B19]|uniref:ShlB/FhaC/HecB family hemolysin secretion/activation protein n=1 Tax=Erythrobacter sp. BLCC-B19 TaxID=3025315 RepID=UPI0023607B52|nr:ShlB/FhaC/HecB family hemolysin secretion/activation protein [Erythrobacter sp. BLCC-B19]WDA39846.1 ShlB/FhaC/HecB family hemolysin secretion/activation protein [Erythrobacter sp. BLCC-B19]